MRKLRVSALGGIIIAVALFTAACPAPPPPAPSGPISFRGICAMKYTAPASLYEIRSTFDVTFHGHHIGGNKVRITHVSYQFGMANYHQWPSGAHLGYVERGNKSNVNITYPVSRNSPDSLAPSGTWNHADFDISNGTRLSAQGILDVKNAPDPSCTASVTAGWGAK